MTFRVRDDERVIAIRELIDRNVFLVDSTHSGLWFYKHGTCGYMFRTVVPLDISTWYCPRCADSQGMP